jgi:hypothetical protein
MGVEPMLTSTTIAGVITDHLFVEIGEIEQF